MALTKKQLLLNGLELFKVEQEAIIGIMIALQDENQNATQEEILLKTAEIKSGL